MKLALLTLLRTIFRITGQDLLQCAEARLLAHVEAYESAHRKLMDQVFERADENDKLREKIADNQAANAADRVAMEKAGAAADRLKALVHG